MIALDDIGAITARAFDDPGAWIGRQVEIAGDEVTVGEAAAAYRRLKGRRPRYVPLPPSLIALGDRSAAAMFRWCRAEGYRADIPALRRVIPELRDLAEGLEKATPMKAGLRPVVTSA